MKFLPPKLIYWPNSMHNVRYSSPFPGLSLSEIPSDWSVPDIVINIRRGNDELSISDRTDWTKTR